MLTKCKSQLENQLNSLKTEIAQTQTTLKNLVSQNKEEQQKTSQLPNRFFLLERKKEELDQFVKTISNLWQQ